MSDDELPQICYDPEYHASLRQVARIKRCPEKATSTQN